MLYPTNLTGGIFTNPSKASSKTTSQNSIYIGVVTKIADGKVIVKIPKLNPTAEFGPCNVYGNFPTIGQYVPCSYIDNRHEHIVVFGSSLTTDAYRDLKINLYMEVL